MGGMGRRSATVAAALLGATVAYGGPGSGAAGGRFEGLDRELFVPRQEAAPPASNPFLEAMRGGEVIFRYQYRYEDVDQDGVPKDAHASTLRTALGYRTAPLAGWSALLEFLDVHVVGQTLYNDTAGGPTNRPVVADPEGTDVHRVWVQWEDQEVGTFRAGRQFVSLDNQRFVGPVAWRQREQTFDSVTASGDVGAFDWFYGFLTRVNRVFGPESPLGEEELTGHLANLAYELDPGKLTVYAYHLDFDQTVGRSSLSVGSRFGGSTPVGETTSLLYAAEYAHQSDVADNPSDLSADYVLAELGADFGPAWIKGGYEQLGGDSSPGAAFQTPLATLFAFNGWADRFLNTPDAGLQDLYFKVGGEVGGYKLEADLHDFRSDVGSTGYGTELDLSVIRPINSYITIGIRFAQYDTDGNAAFAGDVDVRKAWVWIAGSI